MLGSQALIYVDMGDLSNALAQGQAALAIRQKVLSSEHPDLAHSLTGNSSDAANGIQLMKQAIGCPPSSLHCSLGVVDRNWTLRCSVMMQHPTLGHQVAQFACCTVSASCCSGLRSTVDARKACRGRATAVTRSPDLHSAARQQPPCHTTSTHAPEAGYKPPQLIYQHEHATDINRSGPEKCSWQ